MVTLVQETAARKSLIEYNKAMRKRILKILAEPITNSDQIYKDMTIEQTDNVSEEPKPINIYINPKRKEFCIVDHGGSMSYQELKDRFEQRSQKQVTHHKASRSIFGQGISDLMFSRNKGGTINCIKDGKLWTANFRKRRTKSKETGKDVILPLIILNDKKIKVDEDIRKKFYIPKGNGTCVKFKFEQAGFPRKDVLISGLINTYMLRFINSNPKRDVRVIYVNPQGDVIEDQYEIKYQFRKVDDAEKLSWIDKLLEFERWKLNINGWVASWHEPLTQGEVEKDERQGGLLIIDENDNVYDLTYIPHPILEK